ncbi:MAG: type I 3-dehydroquinate dehydratase [Chitinispirillales bacterium]|jgi:3-dehydroquinate dehydratase-1|nr:type I 3-dehydroquinate dehydratase [Chitinispirillales bacterium]
MLIKNLELKNAPRVVGIIDRIIPQDYLEGLAHYGVDMYEIRVDLFTKPVDKIFEYIEHITDEVATPFIGTIRENDLNRSSSVEQFSALVPFVDCVDIELGASGWRKMTDAAKEGGSVIIVSKHDYRKTPDKKGLSDIVKRCVDQGADIVKIAVTAADISDVTHLLRFTEECEVPLVTIAMGDIGRVSRVIAPLFGSLFTYGYLRKPLAPGQLSAEKLAKELNYYFPNRRSGDSLNLEGLK